MSKNKRYTSSQLAQKKRQQKIIKRFVVLIFVFVVILGGSFWSGHDSVTINQIEISDNQYINDSDLIMEIENLIDKKYFHLFSRKNFLLLPRNKIKDLILDNNFAIKDVNLSLKNKNNLLVDLDEYKATAKWCGISSDKLTDNCFLINESGLIYAQEDVFKPENIFIAYGVHESDEEIIGKYFVDEKHFQNILNVILGLDDFEIEVLSFETIDEETFVIQSAKGPYFLISIHNQPEQVLNNLKTVIQTEEINRAQFRNLEYIDLRFGNRVYYQIR